MSRCQLRAKKPMSLARAHRNEDLIIEAHDGCLDGSLSRWQQDKIRAELGCVELSTDGLKRQGAPIIQTKEERLQISKAAREKTSIQLEAMEAVIAKNITSDSFYPMGCALRTIRNGKLFRYLYPSFERYAEDVWDMKKTLGYGLIAAADVMDNLKGCGFGILPANEGQVRPLTRLKPDKQREAWETVLAEKGEGRISARLVSGVVERIRTPKNRPWSKRSRAKACMAKLIENAAKINVLTESWDAEEVSEFLGDVVEEQGLTKNVDFDHARAATTFYIHMQNGGAVRIVVEGSPRQ